ncbi:MAG: bacteriohemerythrin [Humidesulfovibrio sp.]|nr:bacteriohemerythrin [Humidesulfovibrio sp.]
MPNFEWDDSLNLGDPLLDRQHKTLIALLNRASEACQASDKDTEIMHCLTGMYLYAKEHFFDEEGLMDRLGYPDRDAHKKQHKFFVDKTHAFTDGQLEGSLNAPDLLAFLTTWLREHITVEDAKILRFANTQDAPKR